MSSVLQETLIQCIREKLATLGDGTAMIDGLHGRTVSFRDVLNGIDKTASGLAGRGFGKGDV